MVMKISLGTIEVDNLDRRALNWTANVAGLASRNEVRTYVRTHGTISLSDHASDFITYLKSPPSNLTIRERAQLKHDRRRFG